MLIPPHLSTDGSIYHANIVKRIAGGRIANLISNAILRTPFTGLRTIRRPELGVARGAVPIAGMVRRIAFRYPDLDLTQERLPPARRVGRAD